MREGSTEDYRRSEKPYRLALARLMVAVALVQTCNRFDGVDNARIPVGGTLAVPLFENVVSKIESSRIRVRASILFNFEWQIRIK